MGNNKMIGDIMLTNRGFDDLNPLLCGTEPCEPGHCHGPAVRTYYLLHYVLSGEGVFYRKEECHRVTAGGFFLIRPEEVTTYIADERTPWHYVWIGFQGKSAALLNEAPPTGTLPKSVFTELHDAITNGFAEWGTGREFYLSSILHRILAELSATKPSAPHYARRAENYIRTMYMQDISVEKIATSLSLNRRYLSRLFKARYGVTMQNYLVSVRLEAAAKLLTAGYTVAESAQLCGYHDPFHFSKMFHRHYGVWPRDYAAESEDPT